MAKKESKTTTIRGRWSSEFKLQKADRNHTKVEIHKYDSMCDFAYLSPTAARKFKRWLEQHYPD